MHNFLLSASLKDRNVGHHLLPGVVTYVLTAESAGDLRNKAGDLEFSGADEDGGSEGPGE